jgi:hypothetical protein
VELAIILPVLLLLVLAALDLGRVFLGWVVLNNASRVGANYAALNPDAWGTPGSTTKRATYDSLVRDARADAAIALGGCDAQAVPAPAFPAGTELGDFAELELECRFDPITPLIGDIFASNGGQLTVASRSVFPIRTGAVAAPPSTNPPTCALADFTWAPQVPRVGEQVAFTDTSVGGPRSWLWFFGDGTPGSFNQNPRHTYTAAGTYTVTLTVDGCGAQQKSTPITVAEPTPSPDPSASVDPSASAPPSASLPPTPAPCYVPGFTGTRKNDAPGIWTAAGFTTQITFLPGSGNYKIEYQSVVGGQESPCNVLITVGPDPIPTP